jgi:WD40 repeat protein
VAEVRQGSSPSSIVVLVGASGSGKSSLLNAGLLAAIAKGSVAGAATAAVVTPGQHPLESLQRVAGTPDVLVVDQFEELFTLCDDPAERREFVTRLAAADRAWTSVVIGLRADFYAMAMDVPALVPALQHNQVLVTPLSEEELRAAVVEPARAAGAAVEPALVDTLLADLAPAGVHERAHDPGALPLLSHALLATWTRTRRRELTLATYREAGGISGAVQQTAEEVWDQLDEEDQQLSRRMFLRLVNVSDGAALTRRRVARAEIDDLGRPGAVDQLVDTYVARRLLTVEFDAVQISHEALLTAWPRLRAWIEEDRAGLRLHRQLTEAANQWAAGGRDPELLLSGRRLSGISDWADDLGNAADLNRGEQEYLLASRNADDARRRAEHRQNRTLKRLLLAVGVLTVAAIVLAALALHARNAADRQRTEATQARDQALSRQVAVEVSQLAAKDPALAAQLSVAAYSIAPTADARSALLASTGSASPTRLVASAQPLQALAISSAQQLMTAAGADGLVHLWRTGASVPSSLGTLRPSAAGTIFALALSQDGRLLAAGGAGRAIDLWDVSSPESPRHLATIAGFDNTVFALAFSPDGQVLAAGAAQGPTTGTVRRYLMADPGRPAPLAPITEPAFVQAMAFDASGQHLIAGTSSGDLIVFGTPSSDRAQQLSRTTVSAGHALLAVASDPAGPLVATGGLDRTLRLWRLPTSGRPALVRTQRDFTTWVTCLAFDHAGTTVYAGSSDDTVHMYSVSGTVHEVLPHPEPVTAVALDVGRIVTAGNDGTVRLWPTAPATLDGASDSVFSLAYARDQVLAVGAGSADGHLALWRGHTRLSASIRAMDPGDALDGASAISADGALVATGSSGGRVGLWSTRDPRRPAYLGVLPGVETGARTTVEGVAFSADSHWLAAGGDDGIVRVWDVSDPRHPRATAVLRAATNYVFSVAFSHDGRYLAAASADGRAYVWRLTSGGGHLLAMISGFHSYVYSVVFSPVDDTLAVGAADSTGRLYAVTGRGRPTPVGPSLLGATDAIYAMAFSPDGSMLAGAAQDGAVHLWAVRRSRYQLASLVVGGGMSAVAFSPDGTTIAASGTDHAVHLWQASPKRAAKAICATAGTPITRTEWNRYVPGAAYAPPCR